MSMAPTANGRKGRQPGTEQDSTIFVKRPPYTQVAFDDLNLNEDIEKKTLREKLCPGKCDCSIKTIVKQICTFFPIIKVIRYYKLKENIIIDILSGITVGILHIPQALAFGQLTSVKVENGLYTSVWPIILYVLFGTSAHVSMGTSAVICIVTAGVVDREAEAFKQTYKHPLPMNSTLNGTLGEIDWEQIPEFMDYKERIAINLSFTCGLIMIFMGLFKLGFVTAYLSESFFSAFTSGAAVHIASSQVPALLGVDVARSSGAFKIIRTYSSIFAALPETYYVTPLITVFSMAVLFLVKECVNERFKHKLFIPIPVELLVVIFATLISYLIGLDQPEYHVNVVGQLSSTIPPPALPNLSGIGTYLVDGFVIAILIFANTIAMAKICAKKHNYEINDSQELIAYGMCNFVSAFMWCFPSAVAPPRSMVASSMNTKTTLTGVFVTALMLMVIMVMSALFQPLPKAALSAIIVVALKGLFVQMKDCVRFWKINKYDFIIWLFTIVSVVFVDIDIGLGVGVIISLITVVFQTQFSRGYRLAVTTLDGIMVENRKYKNSKEIPGVKIFRFQSNLYFANAELFRNALYKSTVNPRKLLKMLQKQKKLGKLEEPKGVETVNGNMGLKASNGQMKRNLSSVSLESNGKSPSNRESVTSNASMDNPSFCLAEENLILGNGKSNGISQNFTSISNYTVPNRRYSVTSSISMMTELEIDPDDGEETMSNEWVEKARKIHHIIVDCSTMNYLDLSGVSVLTHIFKEYDHVNITLFLTGCSRDIRKTMHHAGVYDKIPKDNIFIDLEDAIAIAKNMAVKTIPVNLEDFSDDEAAENSYVTRM